MKKHLFFIFAVVVVCVFGHSKQGLAAVDRDFFPMPVIAEKDMWDILKLNNGATPKNVSEISLGYCDGFYVVEFYPAAPQAKVSSREEYAINIWTGDLWDVMASAQRYDDDKMKAYIEKIRKRYYASDEKEFERLHNRSPDCAISEDFLNNSQNNKEPSPNSQ